MFTELEKSYHEFHHETEYARFNVLKSQASSRGFALHSVPMVGREAV